MCLSLCVTVAVVKPDGQVVPTATKTALRDLLGIDIRDIAGFPKTACLCACDLIDVAERTGMYLDIAWDTYDCDFSLTRDPRELH